MAQTDLSAGVQRPARRAELPTILLAIALHAGWAAVTLHASALPAMLATPLLVPLLVLHSSLQHEVIHGHPFADRRLSELTVFPALGLFVPFLRFRDTHLAHHHDPSLTDPHDDPESNYLDPVIWARLGRPLRALLLANNTLLGRMILGPAIGMAVFVAGDIRAIRAGHRAVARAWAHHVAGVAPVALWLGWAGTPVWAYLGACYLALSVLKVRTFLEHRAHERHPARSVVIEDRGPLAFLFLYNNFHAVHHAHPRLPWYRLPDAYEARRGRVLARNGGYRYGSYAEVFRRHLLSRKDPVAHPLTRRT